MDKRIKIVWLLSLVSALLVIGMQGYWLYNQYEYVLNNYVQKIAEQILNAGEEEFSIRKTIRPKQITYLYNRNSVYSNNPDSVSLAKQEIRISFNPNSSTHSDSLNYDLKNLNLPPIDTAKMFISFNPKMSEDSLHRALDRAISNMSSPFQEGRLDSILSTKLHNIPYTLSSWTDKDTTNYFSYWKRTGSILRPEVLVSYAYSPLEKKGIFIQAQIPPNPIFMQMGIQLLFSLSLILLLLGCFVFQIKTILKQKKLGEVRQSFVNTMIHELKRPVQTLKTFVSFLGDKEMRSDEVMTQQIVQDSMFELDNLSAYLNKLKDMVQADSVATPLQLTKFDLQALTEKVIRLTHQPTGKKISFTTSYEMESTLIEADPVHIANVLSNLIENAVKYSGDNVAIGIKAIQKGKELCLMVTDNGIGIPQVEQEKVFVKFYRGSNLPDKNIPGIGLGLSYVKLIIEAHHGYVSLNSNSVGGTTVTLVIPQ